MPALALALLVPYGVAVLGPLRLTDDAVAYLRMAEAIATGSSYTPTGVDYPRGYPALLAFLDVAGIARPAAFVALNLLALAVGCACWLAVLRRSFGLGRRAAWALVLALLLVHDVIATAAIPLTDPLFFAVSAAVVALCERARRETGPRILPPLVLASALAAAGVEIRSIGLALFAPVAAVLLAEPRLHAAWRRRPRLVSAAGGAVAAAAAAFGVLAVSSTGYVDAVGRGWSSQGLLELQNKLDVVATLAANVALQRWPAALHSVRPVLGVLVLLVVALGAAARRHALGPVDAFVAATLAVLLVWPQDAARLWIPLIVPLLAYGLAGARVAVARARPLVGVFALWAAIFVAAGAAMLAHSVSLTFAGTAAFPSRWVPPDKPGIRAGYDLAYGVGPRRGADPDVVRVLRRYDPARARPAPTDRG